MKKPGSTAITERFTQWDINVDRLPLHSDAELPPVIHEVMTGLDLPARSDDSCLAPARLRGEGAAAPASWRP
ncbi:hypothetical protein [Streptomyces sp. NBC_01276]|uniref:hypothetical protein n=1 Tax=Streptomyces sp. NBC_01276 TaxID=2903808 RepID=UPI00352FDA0D